MSWQRSLWFRVPLTCKLDKVGHGEVTMNNGSFIPGPTQTFLYCTATEEDLKLEILDLNRRMIVLSMISYMQKAGFL